MQSQSNLSLVLIGTLAGMRKTLALVALAFAMIFSVALSESEARPRPARSSSKSFQANKTFGLGLMTGNPHGFSGKYFVGSSTALDFGLGVHDRVVFRDPPPPPLSIHMDFLWHPIVLASPEPFWLPLYVGVGARILDHNDDRFHDDTHLGVRVPVGIAFDFNRIPLDIFIELSFVLDLIRHDQHDHYDDFDLAIGARYWFN
jgi:hypothetical protein